LVWRGVFEFSKFKIVRGRPSGFSRIQRTSASYLGLNHLHRGGVYSGEVEYAVKHSDINSGPCRQRGGELELKATIDRPGERLETHFFQCKACGHIHAVETQSS
jgi:hypothetical protein